MILYERSRVPWLPAAHTSALLAISTFAALLAAFVIASALLAGEAPLSVKRVQSAPGQLRAGVDPDPDLETLVVDVSKQGESVHYRIGSHDSGSALELRRLLEPLARLGGPISVRISHDGPFIHTATAIAACRDAGFTTVELVLGKPSR
jgi:biopolymer transport protein ExbD